MSMLTSSIKNLFSRPFTTRYPKVPADLPPGNRGRVLYDMSRCIFCRKCERSCPTVAIITDRDAKTETVIRHRCIGCNTCVEVCPTETITMVQEYSRPDTAPTVKCSPWTCRGMSIASSISLGTMEGRRTDTVHQVPAFRRRAGDAGTRTRRPSNPFIMLILFLFNES